MTEKNVVPMPGLVLCCRFTSWMRKKKITQKEAAAACEQHEHNWEQAESLS